jgi:ferredoxin
MKKYGTYKVFESRVFKGRTMRVRFVSLNKEYNLQGVSDFLEAKEAYPALPWRFGCCRGTCGVCVFKVIEGAEFLGKQGKAEKNVLKKKGLEKDHRLACQCALNGDVAILIE